jgi:hypothetical protein
MNLIRVILFILIMCVMYVFHIGCASNGNGNKAVIVDDGVITAVLVIPDNPSPVVKASAHELNLYIAEITGAVLPLKRADEITDTEQTIISIGSTKFADELGLSDKDMIFGEFICRQKGNVIAIFGKDNNIFEQDFGRGENGNWNGVCRFSEEYLGVRWLWPGDYGLVIPKQKILSVRLDIDFSEKPQISGRRVRDKIYLQDWKDDWAGIGIDEKRWKEIAASTYRWQKFMLKGGTVEDVPGGHGFTDWWDKYHKEHPEWFALQPDGTRMPPLKSNFCAPSTAKLCVSNPEVVRQVVKNAVEHYKNSKEIFRAGINDNANVALCTCEKCRVQDFPEQASPFTYRYRSGATDYCYITDRYVKFWNEIGQEFFDKCPDKLIAVTAYGCITEPPVRNSIKYKNILLAYMGFEYLNDKMLFQDRKWWKRWSENTVGKLSLRSNNLVGGYGFPYFYGRELAKDFRLLYAGRLYTIENEALFCYFATNGLNYYVLYKLMWNPGLNVEELIDDYCSRGFGKAAVDIKKYYNELEKLTKEVASHNWRWRKPLLEGLPTIYTPEKIDKLYAILVDAEKKVSGDEAGRIEFLKEGLDYTRVLADILYAKANGADKQTIEKAYIARDNFFKNQKFPLSVPYPADMTWRRYNPVEM